MGFVAKSAFWLGLVYSAMPFDAGSPTALAPTGTAISRSQFVVGELRQRGNRDFAPESR